MPYVFSREQIVRNSNPDLKSPRSRVITRFPSRKSGRNIEDDISEI